MLGKQSVEKKRQVRVDGVPVEADCALVFGIVRKHSERS
jgi:hypothetical protein